MTPRNAYRTTDIPNKPGVYIFRDRLSTVIYVGKAKSLKRRLSSYFQPSRARTADPKLRSLINSIAWFDVTITRTAEEALLLESRLIKQYTPRYNVVLRDDKRYLLIKIDMNAPYPRPILARVRKDDGCLYFGPYPIAGALRDTIDYLSRHFGLRSCSARIPGEVDYTHCNDDIVRFCSAPCMAKVTQEEYRQRVQQAIAVIEGQTQEVVADLERRMNQYAEAQQFERAARMRDVIQNLKSVFGAQNRTFVHSFINNFPGNEGVLDLQMALDLPHLPEVIECFDISNIMGTFAVGSMVSFVNGAPSKKDYRHFRIKKVSGIDDFAMMREVVERRYRRILDESGRLPDLIVIDGGRGQLNAAREPLTQLGLDYLPIIGLAKKQEEIFMPDRAEPIRLERFELSLRLVQSIRDEAHRFAITFHQQLRRKRMLNSILDEIQGVGKKRKEQILTEFGSVSNLRRHTPEQLCERVPGIGRKLAEHIMQHLKRTPKSD